MVLTSVDGDDFTFITTIITTAFDSINYLGGILKEYDFIEFPMAEAARVKKCHTLDNGNEICGWVDIPDNPIRDGGRPRGGGASIKIPF